LANYYYISGTSSGIGKVLAHLLLQDADNFVVGIARRCTISHANYRHFTLDLSDLKASEKFQFQQHIDAEKIVLINNAGTLGSVKHVGNLAAQDIIRTFNLNTLTPSIFMNSFLATYKDHAAEKTILNISSGAATSPIDGWASYCASKAALDMYSKVIFEEQKQSNSVTKTRIYSIRPGKVDTAMQAEIRDTTAEDFSLVQAFKNYKAKGELLNPDHVAQQYIDFLNRQESDTAVVSALS
jgi:benzil reductase ((S)-benzoin forming)